MSRYDFVLLATQSEDFIARLRELGLVDITTLGWEPQEQDRQLLTDIEQYRKAVDYLATFAKDNDELVGSASPYTTGEEAFERYMEAMQRRTALQGESQRLRKLSEELEPWGEFSADDVASLAKGGVVLRYFTAQSSAFDSNVEAWSSEHTLCEINRSASMVYFVVVAAADAEFENKLEELKQQEIMSFFSALNNEKYGYLLDSVYLQWKACGEVRRNGEKLPYVLEGVPAFFDRFMQFIRDVGISPVTKCAPNSTQNLTLAQMEGFSFEPSDKRTKPVREGEHVKVKVVSSGWKLGNAIISNPVIHEEN
jgi:hypothetical protein